MSQISAYVIAFNEKEKISSTINSLKWADEIILVDSGSADGTAEIATELGARVVQVPFQGFGHLRNQAIQACRFPWVFSLDADERCTPAVRDEILAIINDPNSVDVYKVPRRNFFMGRWIKHSGWYPNYRQPQLFRKEAMAYTLEPVHEGFRCLTDRPLGFLKSAIWQVPFGNLDEVMHKANRYSSLGVAKLEEKGVQASMGKALWHGSWAFIKHYFFKLGLLDGWPGFVIALGNFYGTYFRYAKLYEKQQQSALPETPVLDRPGVEVEPQAQHVPVEVE